jgi:hypothetical protein
VGNPVKDKPSDLVLKDRDEVGEIMQILFRAMNRGCEMAIKRVGDLKNPIRPKFCTSSVVGQRSPYQAAPLEK